MPCILESHIEWQKLDEREVMEKSKELDTYSCGDAGRKSTCYKEKKEINELNATQTCKSLTSLARDDLIQIPVPALSLLLPLNCL